MTYQTIKSDRSVIDLGGIGYPGLLADIPEPPKRLFVAGDPAVLSLPSLAISGSRRATPYGRNMASRFATLAANAGLSIVTGGARGVDSVATKAALDAGAKVAVVLAAGDRQAIPRRTSGCSSRWWMRAGPSYPSRNGISILFRTFSGSGTASSRASLAPCSSWRRDSPPAPSPLRSMQGRQGELSGPSPARSHATTRRE